MIGRAEVRDEVTHDADEPKTKRLKVVHSDEPSQANQHAVSALPSYIWMGTRPQVSNASAGQQPRTQLLAGSRSAGG